MRWVIWLAVGILLATHAPQIGWPVRAKIDPTVRAALEVRCGELQNRDRRACETELIDEFEVGAIEPESVLRLHCTRWKGTWSTLPEQPLPMCAERFGGWITG